MAKLGSTEKPAVVRVRTEARAREIASLCAENGWHYIIGFEPDKPEDVSDVERLLNPALPVSTGPKTGRNEPCPCGSGLKYKRCCGGPGRRQPSA